MTATGQRTCVTARLPRGRGGTLSRMLCPMPLRRQTAAGKWVGRTAEGGGGGRREDQIWWGRIFQTLTGLVAPCYCMCACLHARMHVELLANRYARAGLCVHARTRHSRQVRCAWPEFAYGHTLLPACINMHTCAGVQFPYYQGAVLPPTPQQISIYQSLSAGSAPEEGAGVDRGSLVDA